MTTLEAVLERIEAVAKPDRVILFGSAARGTAGPHSDLDFLVIKHGIPSRRQLAQAISSRRAVEVQARHLFVPVSSPA